jgi:hypothetical protein
MVLVSLFGLLLNKVFAFGCGQMRFACFQAA